MYRLNKVSFHYRTAYDGRADGVNVEDLQIAETGITAVIGPSGSGKTTLLSMLAGFVRSDVAVTGVFTFGNKNLAQSSLVPGDVAFVFQSSLLLGAATAGLNTLQGHVASGKATLNATRYQKLAQRLGLNPNDGALFSRRARELSGGQAQRMAVLRALATDAKAILCDEPTSSLDPENAKQVLGALKEWSRDRPVVWVTHGLAEAARHADHFVFMRAGQIQSPTKAQAADLASGDVARRLEALEAISAYDNTWEDEAAEASGNDMAINISGQDYRRWIAHALSMDSSAAEWGASDGVGSVQNPNENAVLTQLVPGMAQANKGLLAKLVRALRFLSGYTQQATMLLLAIMTFQIFVGLSVYFVANAFISERLQDPAVARLSFERVISSELDARPMGAVLNFTQLDAISGRLEAALGPGASDADLARTRATGIRHERHLFRGRVEGTEQPDGRCSFSSIQAMVTAPDDPLLSQIQPLDGSSGADLAAMIKTTYEAEQFARVAVVTRGARDRLGSAECSLPEGTTIDLDWNGAQAPPYYDLTKVIVVDALPPSYPYFPEVLLFENDYQNFVRILGANAGAFETANAYFPLNAFSAMRAEVQAMGYTIKEDTEPAVKLLQNVERIFQIGPALLLTFSIIVGATVLSRTLSSILELNKRVLTLFRAHGFQLKDIQGVMFLHFRPALIGVLLVVFVAGEATWFLFEGILSRSDLGNLTMQRYMTHVITAAGSIFVSGAVIWFQVFNWWHTVGRRLSDNLKE